MLLCYLFVLIININHMYIVNYIIIQISSLINIYEKYFTLFKFLSISLSDIRIWNFCCYYEYSLIFVILKVELSNLHTFSVLIENLKNKHYTKIMYQDISILFYYIKIKLNK